MILPPRAKRLNLSFPVEFIQGSDRTSGVCLNISNSGMLAQFRAPPEVWSTGTLWADAGIVKLLIPARILRVVGLQAGIIFHFDDEKQRDQVREVVAFAAKNTHLADGGPPF